LLAEGIDLALPPVRVPSYVSPKLQDIGHVTGYGGRCQKCGTLNLTARSETGICLCIKCWKKSTEIVRREGNSVVVDERTRFSYLQQLAKWKQIDGMYHLGGSLASYPMRSGKELDNELEAVYRRLTNPLPPVDQVEFNAFLRFVRKSLPVLLEKFNQFDLVDFEEWNQHFEPGRRRINETTWKTMNMGKDMLPLDAKEITRILKQKPFLKMDKDIKGDGLTAEKAGRFIMAQSNEVAIILGMVVQSISKPFEQLWKRDASKIIFACGLDTSELSETFYEAKMMNANYLDDDFSQYDSTQHSQFHRLLVEIYTYIMDNYCSTQDKPNLLANFWKVRTQIGETTVGRTRLGLMFKLVGTMKSGQADTCLGNTIINVLTHLYAFVKATGLSVEEVSGKMLMHVLGDDNSMAVPKEWDITGVENTLIKLGLLPKLEEKQFKEIKFLNLIPYPIEPLENGRDVQLGLLPGRMLERILWTHKLPAHKEAHCVALAKCLLAVSGHVPFIEKFAEGMMLAYGGNCTELDGRKKYQNDWQLEKSRTIRESFGWWLRDSLNSKTIYKANEQTKSFLCDRYSLDLDTYEVALSRCERGHRTNTDSMIAHLILTDKS